MFSIIPYNLSAISRSAPAQATVCEVTKSAQLLIPGKVVAANNIPQGVVTAPIRPDLLSGHLEMMQISVKATSSGTIDVENPSKETCRQDIHWVRSIRLAEDCHSCNVQLNLKPPQRPTTLGKSSTPKLTLQAIRSIEAGQELLLWFSEDILAMLHMAFLIPANIQGQKRYACTRCLALYESPNPLKLHITLACGKYPIEVLWKKLENLLESERTTAVRPREEFKFKLTAERNECRQVIDLSQKRLKSNDVSNLQSTSHNSAFKPFQKQENSRIFLSDVPNMQNWPFHFSKETQASTANVGSEAQIETIFSSLGKSKEGHICLYCGKCYSRKYGLKIHIRTHTGYKPLKCKYCLRPFGDPSNLNKHVRLHAEGDTPYRCELCGKVLVRRRDLDRHLKSRHMSEIHPGTNIVEDTVKSEHDVSDEEQEKN